MVEVNWRNMPNNLEVLAVCSHPLGVHFLIEMNHFVDMMSFLTLPLSGVKLLQRPVTRNNSLDKKENSTKELSKKNNKKEAHNRCI